MNWLALVGLEWELRRWRGAGRSPRLWWRDDDARYPSPALDRLLAAAGDIPLALAIIPDGELPALATRLRTATTVTVSQHGVDHVNRRAPGEPPSEYPADAAAADIASRVREARDRMASAGLSPAFYTPPWNQISPAMSEALILAGAPALSADVPARAVPGLIRFDSHIDILRWKGGPRFRGYGRVLRGLTRQLRRRRLDRAFDDPIGLLTHHLVHDEPAWRFLAWFTAYSRDRFTWRGFAQLGG